MILVRNTKLLTNLIRSQICHEFADFQFQGWTPSEHVGDSKSNETGHASEEPVRMVVNLDTNYNGGSDDDDDGDLDGMNFDIDTHGDDTISPLVRFPLLVTSLH